MEIAIISQARTGSTRLPSKVLKKINGKTILQYHIERLEESKYPVIIATTTKPSDDAIVELCESLNIPVVRGSEDNVLSRYLLAVEKFNIKNIVRVTSDCPLIDGNFIGSSIDYYLEQKNAQLYMSNMVERSYPRGFDFEICSADMLIYSAAATQEKEDLEHVTLYIRKNLEKIFSAAHIVNPEDKSSYRITVDTPEDFELIEKLILEQKAHEKNHEEIIDILDAHPELSEINAHIEQKKIGQVKY